MSDHSDYDRALTDERRTNETYLELLQQAAEQSVQTTDDVGLAASIIWGGAAPLPAGRRSGALIGRVALDCCESDLDDFYVGPTHLDHESVLVVSWVAPLARLFFEGRDWDQRKFPHLSGAPDPQNLLARRTFATRVAEIRGFRDDLEPGTNSTAVFQRQIEPPSLTPPPAGDTPPARSPSTPTPGPRRFDRPTTSDSSAQEPATGDRDLPVTTGDLPTARARPNAAAAPSGRSKASPPGAHRGQGPADATLKSPRLEPDGPEPRDSVDLPDRGAPGRSRSGTVQVSPEAHRLLERAADLVIDALEQPRLEKLQSVLSTLQPDQFRYATWPATEHLAVQGHPGTGKTIVAAHRAAYLTHAEPDHQLASHPNRPGRVALVGPNDQWAKHVSGAVADAGATSVEIISLQRLIRRLSDGAPPDGPPHPLHRQSERPYESDQANLSLAQDFVRSIRPGSKIKNKSKQMRLVVNTIIHECDMMTRAVAKLEEDHRSWLCKARDYDRARGDESYLLFLASVGMALDLCNLAQKFDHLIVDEVQDLRPVEWKILGELLNCGGRWSLFGDMNQRRADVTWSSWQELLEQCKLYKADGGLITQNELVAGYRSTQQILEFAGKLLPIDQRNHVALRQGTHPVVREVGKADLTREAYREARDLVEEFHDGQVAVIGWDLEMLRPVITMFRKQGWTLKKPSNLILYDGTEPTRRISVMRAVYARGLEFDGVVVVEPGSFKKNRGRHSSLYTSLTRANKKLVVLYSKALPPQLRKRDI